MACVEGLPDLLLEQIIRPSCEKCLPCILRTRAPLPPREKGHQRNRKKRDLLSLPQEDTLTSHPFCPVTFSHDGPLVTKPGFSTCSSRTAKLRSDQHNTKEQLCPRLELSLSLNTAQFNGISAVLLLGQTTRVVSRSIWNFFTLKALHPLLNQCRY